MRFFLNGEFGNTEKMRRRRSPEGGREKGGSGSGSGGVLGRE
jgi:hypothetical protein